MSSPDCQHVFCGRKFQYPKGQADINMWESSSFFLYDLVKIRRNNIKFINKKKKLCSEDFGIAKVPPSFRACLDK